jgi:hypothetical protein
MDNNVIFSSMIANSIIMALSDGAEVRKMTEDLEEGVAPFYVSTFARLGVQSQAWMKSPELKVVQSLSRWAISEKWGGRMTCVEQGC